MSPRKISILILLFGVSAASAETAPLISTSAFQTVCGDLRAVTRVEADFTEDKTLHILSHPLHSSGTLMFAPDHGVYRVMREPMHQELLITRTQLVQKDAQGKVERMNVSRQPAAQAFVTVFLSFFSGDPSAWDKTFDVSFSGTRDAWRMEFVPRRKSALAKAISGMVLEGREGVLDGMTLTEANGDITHTVYSNQRVSRGPDDAQALGGFPMDLTTP